MTTGLIRVALTWYPKSNAQTRWVRWSHLPPIGTSVHLEDDIPCRYIWRYAVVADPWPGKDEGEPIPEDWSLWHVEVVLRDTP